MSDAARRFPGSRDTTALGSIAGVELVVLLNDQPWRLGIDTLAVSVGAGGGGLLAAAVMTRFTVAGWSSVDFAAIRPDAPVVCLVNGVREVDASGDASLRRIVLATARDPDDAAPYEERPATLPAVGRATRAVVLAAEKAGARVLGVPLLGAGAIGLPTADVAGVAVPAVRRAVRELGNGCGLERVVFVCQELPDQRAIALAWSYEEMLGQARREAPSDPGILAEAARAGLDEDALRRALDVDETVLWQPCLQRLAALRAIDEERESLRASLIGSHEAEARALLHDVWAAEVAGATREAESNRKLLLSVDSRIARVLEGNTAWRQLARRRVEAAAALRHALLESMFVQLRLAINERLNERALAQDRRTGIRRPLTRVPTADLRAEPKAATVVPTAAKTELDALTDFGRPHRISVGVAGPRGCGKSTLLKNRVLGEGPGSDAVGIRLFLQAPASYVPREFLSYLYAMVCDEVLRGATPRPPSGVDAPTPARLRLSSLLTLVVPSALGLAAGVALIAAAAGNGSAAQSLTALGGAIVVAAAVPLLLLSSRSRLVGTRRLHADNEGELMADLARFTWRLPSVPRLLAVAVASGGVGVLAAGRTTAREAMGAVLLVAALGSAVWFTPWPAAKLLRRKNPDRPVNPPAPLRDPRETVRAAALLGAARRLTVIMAAAAAQLAAAITGAVLIGVPASVAAPDIGLVLGTVLVAAGCTALVVGGRWRAYVESDGPADDNPPDAEVVQAAQDLRRLRYQRSVMSGWTSTAKVAPSNWMPFGVDLAASGSTTEADVPLLVPEIVEGIKTLLKSRSPAVVAIDELDKIESVDKARDFLNEIKGILDADNTRFLVSMSEDAMASFERRGLPFRDVFDSAFDEVVRVPYLNAEQARRLIEGRVTGVPEPFLALAYCQSGGLPRDLLRAADRMISLAGEAADGSSLADVARETIHRDMAGKREAVTAAIRSILVEPDVSGVLRCVQGLDVCGSPGQGGGGPCLLDEDWLASLEKLSPILTADATHDVTERRELLRLTVELVGYFFYCRTLLELFDVTEDGPADRLIRLMDTDGGRDLDALAQARQTFSVNPFVAWDQLRTLRDAHGLPDCELPGSLRVAVGP
jgi:hypothetical protein